MSAPLRAVAALLLAALPTALLPAQSPAPEFAAIERAFRELPPEARRLTGPLFWLHGDEAKERLQGLVDRVAEGGNGTLTAESRPHRDWLGPDWFRDLDIVLQQCKARGLQLWIFDEKWWPSQAVGGKVPAQYAAKQLVAEAVVVEGGRGQTLPVPGERLVAVLAGRLADGDAVLGDSIVDLAAVVHDGVLAWTPPAGRWQVMVFRHGQAPGLGQGGGRELSVDGMSRDCVQWLLDTVYQPHFDRFGADFGKTIRGFFYDEPETRGDWGTALPEVLAERGTDWRRAYVAYKFRLAGEEQDAYRLQYLDARAETWGRVMYGMTTAWCEAHGVQSIGHFMEHGGLYRHQDFCAGDVMQLQKYSSMGGIDAVFTQFAWGKRAVNDSPCWQTPKLGSSISHAYGKRDDVAMVEIFGARGQDLTYPEMKWWTDAMQVAGVNFLIPHSFNPRAPRDTDCPPYFWNGGYEPRWPLYRVFADYTSRLSVMLTGGRHVAPVALLTPGQAFAVGKALPVEGTSEALQDALYDCDWIPQEVFFQDMDVDGNQLRLRAEAYRVLVLPAAEVVPYPTLAKAKDFFAAGGVVVACGLLPQRSAATGWTNAELAALRAELFGDAAPSLAVCRQSAAGGRSYFLPANPTPEQWQQVLAGDAKVHPTCEVLAGDTHHWLHVLHRVQAGRDVFFVTNQDIGHPAQRFRLRLTAPGVPECWDALRNEITAVPSRRDGDHVDLDLDLEPNESALLVFAPEARPLPPRPAGPPQRVLPVARVPSPPVRPLPPLADGSPAAALADTTWIWYPEGTPRQDAPAGTRCFRRQVTVPEQAVTRASFVFTADNGAVLYVDGLEVGHSDDGPDGWRHPVVLDLTAQLRPGVHQLALAATNAAGNPGGNPAGVVGKLTVEFAQGPPLVVALDATWKAARTVDQGWTSLGHDDRAWPAAQAVARFGAGPWGRPGTGMLTLSPATADPFDGDVEIPADLDRATVRLVLEFDGVQPEAATAVQVDGVFAGGLLGPPFRLDLTDRLSPGRHHLRLEPFAPTGVRLAVRPAAAPR